MEEKEYQTSFLEVANMFMTHKNYDRVHVNILCFLAQAYYLVFYDEPLFDECFIGGIHGPLWNEAYDHDFIKDGDTYKYGNEDFEFNFTQKQMKVLDAVRKDHDEFDKYDMTRIIKTYDCYKEARSGLQVTDVGDQVIELDNIKRDFAPLFEFGLPCPECGYENDDFLSTEKKMNVIECNKCGLRYIITGEEEVFISKGDY